MAKNVIDIRGLSKTFKGLKAVESVSLTVEEATCFSFLGPNGAGKTTLMGMLYGKVDRDRRKSTSVSVLGFDPLRDSLRIKFRSGVVPQEDNLDEELNVLENLLIYANYYGLNGREARTRADGLLEFMELTEKRKEPIRHLSGGMKRRLVICRALLNKPELLILDEPTTGLDPQVRHLIWDKLRQLKSERTTILLTTHYMEEAFQLSDRLIIMDKAKKILEGSPTELVSKHIERFVLEIHKTPETEKRKASFRGRGIRREETPRLYLLYANEMAPLNARTKGLKPGTSYLRQTNLEDLFLRTTGRALNEQQ